MNCSSRARMRSPLSRYLGEKRVVGDRVHHRTPRRHCQRIAAIGGAVRAEGHAARRLFRREACAQREAAADALGAGENIRRHAVMFMRIHLAGARHAALHLVQHQHQVMLVRNGAQARQEFLRRGADAALALDRFDQKTGSVRPDHRARRFQIVELAIAETGQQRLEPLVHLGLVAGADRRHRPPVKGVDEGDQLGALRIAVLVLVIGARGLDRRFDRFRAGIGEEHRVGKGSHRPAAAPASRPADCHTGWRHASAFPPAAGSRRSALHGYGPAG